MKYGSVIKQYLKTDLIFKRGFCHINDILLECVEQEGGVLLQ